MSLFALSFIMPLVVIALLLFKPFAKFSNVAVVAIFFGFIFALTAPIDASYSVGWFLLGLEFYIDSTAKMFLLFTTLVWFFATLYAVFYIKSHKQSFWLLFLATYLGNFGLCFASDVIGFYLFFTLMSFAAFGLIMHERDSESKDAAILYIKFALFGEILIFLAIIFWIYFYEGFSFSGSYDSLPWGVVLLALIGFGVKVGVFLLHPWLPLAHSKAPAPVSAVLSAVMLKAGILGWIRFLPLGESSYEVLGTILIVLGFFGIFGGIYGITQRGIKQILAYSSISQMGYLVVAIGFILIYPTTKAAILNAVIFFTIHHALVKSSLFLLAGDILKEGFNKVNSFLSTLGAMVLIGLPFTSGAMAKDMLKYSTQNDLLIFLFSMGSFVTALLMLKFLLQAAKIAPTKASYKTKLTIAPLLVASILVSLIPSQSFSIDMMQILPLVFAFLFYSFLIEKKITIKELPTSDIATLFQYKLDLSKLEKPLRLPQINITRIQEKNQNINSFIQDQKTIFLLATAFVFVATLGVFLSF